MYTPRRLRHNTIRILLLHLYPYRHSQSPRRSQVKQLPRSPIPHSKQKYPTCRAPATLQPAVRQGLLPPYQIPQCTSHKQDACPRRTPPLPIEGRGLQWVLAQIARSAGSVCQVIGRISIEGSYDVAMFSCWDLGRFAAATHLYTSRTSYPHRRFRVTPIVMPIHVRTCSRCCVFLFLHICFPTYTHAGTLVV